MSDLDVSKILDAFDQFLMVLENPNLAKQSTNDNVSLYFDNALFVEAAIARTQAENKTDALEYHLHERWKITGRTNLYSCSDFKEACDKLLEMYMKNPALPTSAVDQLLGLYVQSCGRARLNVMIERLLFNAMSTNTVIESLIKLGVDRSKIEDQALIETWEDEAGTGQREEIIRCIGKMLDDGLVAKLVEFAVDLESSSKVKPLIIQSFIARANDNDVAFCLAFLTVDERLFLTVVNDEWDFLKNFVDTVFYFGRNMKLVEGSWVSEHEFGYDHLLKFVRLLLDGPKKVHEFVKETLQLAKLSLNTSIWNDVEKACCF